MKRMIEKYKKYIVSVLFLVVFSLAFWGITLIMSAKECKNKDRDFFLEKESFDVLFFGSSHTENFFDPLRLWKEYGIKSYNFGNPEEPIPVTYWLIANAIETNKPSYIVVDLYMYNRYDGTDYTGYFNYALDPFPISEVKIQAARDLSESRNVFFDKLFPISSYHSRWKNIAADEKNTIDYFVKGSLSYGHAYTMNVVPFADNVITHDEKNVDVDCKDYTYLLKIIELCEENSIKPIFVSTPFSCTQEEQMSINGLINMLKQENVEVVNYNSNNAVIDMGIDMYNLGHVNQSGIGKVSEYFGSYLLKKDEFVDNEVNDSWNDALCDYKTLKNESRWYVDDLDSLLMLLRDEDIESYVYFKNHNMLMDKTIYSLMQNINRDYVLFGEQKISSELKTLNRIDDAIEQNCSYLLDSSVGTFFSEKISLDADNDIRNLLSGTIDDIPEICVIIKDKAEDKVILIKEFTYDGSGYVCNNVKAEMETKYIFR